MAVKRSRANRPSRRAPRSSARAASRRTSADRDRASLEIADIESIRSELDRIAASQPPRWNANPDDVRKSVLKLVLTLVEFIRQILERQAIRRMDAGTMAMDETEAVGLALMRLEETVRDLCGQFDIAPEELNLDLGPVGKLI